MSDTKETHHEKHREDAIRYLERVIDLLEDGKIQAFRITLLEAPGVQPESNGYLTMLGPEDDSAVFCRLMMREETLRLGLMMEFAPKYVFPQKPKEEPAKKKEEPTNPKEEQATKPQEKSDSKPEGQATLNFSEPFEP